MKCITGQRHIHAFSFATAQKQKCTILIQSFG